MLTHEQIQDARRRAAQQLEEVGFVLTDEERDSIEVADFGLSELDTTGLEVVHFRRIANTKTEWSSIRTF